MLESLEDYSLQTIDITTMKFAFDVIQTVVLVGISIYVWILNNHKANSKKIVELEDKHNREIDKTKNRLSVIETKIDNMPDKRSLHNLHQRLNEQAKILHTIEGELKGIGDNNAMILKALMNDKTS